MLLFCRVMKVRATRPKGKSRFSVYDPELPSRSGSLLHYGEITSTKTPKPTRSKFIGLKGDKMYSSPKLSKFKCLFVE